MARISGQGDDLARQIEELRKDLSLKADANPEADARFSSREVPGAPPKPSSVVTVKNVGTLTVQWQPVGIGNLRKYEVQVSTSQAFSSPRTRSTTANEITFSDLEPETTYFVRLRTVTTDSRVSDYTNPVNSDTGKATFVDLQQGAASNPNRVVQTSGFSPSQIRTDGTVSGIYAEVTLDFPTVTNVELVATAKADFSMAAGHSLFVRPLIDGASIQEFENRNDSVASDGRITVPGLGLPDLDISAGTHSFDVEVEVDNNGDGSTVSSLTPVEFILVVKESRR